MEIIGIRTKKSFAGPGLDAIDAEMKIWDDASDGYVYLHMNVYEGEHFTAAKFSIFDYMSGETEEEPVGEFDEEYESLVEAMQSNYIEGFILLNNIVNEMVDITYGHRESIYNYIVSEVELSDDIDEVYDSEDPEGPVTITAEFMYQSKTMRQAAPRRATVTCVDEAYSFRMYDGDENILEEFDDEEAASRSKWSLLYVNLKEKLQESL